MTENVKGKVPHVSLAIAKTKAQKMTDKTTRTTEKMHDDVTASLDQLQHSGAAAQAARPNAKSGAGKSGAGTRTAKHSAGSHMKKM